MSSNSQDEPGELWSLLPTLGYYTSDQPIHIPSMLITRKDGKLIKDRLLDSNNQLDNSTLSIYAARDGNRSLIHAWNFYWIFYLCLFSIIMIFSVISMIVLMRDKSINRLIKVCVFIAGLCASGN